MTSLETQSHIDFQMNTAIDQGTATKNEWILYFFRVNNITDFNEKLEWETWFGPYEHPWNLFPRPPRTDVKFRSRMDESTLLEEPEPPPEIKATLDRIADDKKLEFIEKYIQDHNITDPEQIKLWRTKLRRKYGVTNE